MNRSICWLTLDMNRRDGQCSVSLGQGETGRTLKFRLYENGTPYVIPDGCYVIISGVMDGNHAGESEVVIYNDCYIQDGVVCYDITDANALYTVGVMNCQLQIMSVDGGCVCSPKFQIVVHSAIYAKDTVENSEQYLGLQGLLREFREALRIQYPFLMPTPALKVNTNKKMTPGHWHYIVLEINAVRFDLGIHFVFGDTFYRLHADGTYNVSIQATGNVVVKDKNGSDISSTCKIYSEDLSWE